MKDLTGLKFGRWTVLSFNRKAPYGKSYWNVKCECGNEKQVRSITLTNGESRSCGCLRLELFRNKRIDLTSMKFGKLTVESLSYTNDSGRGFWNVRCECGNTKKVDGGELRRGKTKSCGCLARELSGKRGKQRLTTHGKSRTKTYRAWNNMKDRCGNSNNKAYKHYGGRGIRVCERWLKFENFLKDMGEAPAGLTLERKDVDGGYRPGNCVWATNISQQRNRRDNRKLEYDNKIKTVAEWAEEYGLGNQVLFNRLKNGWPIKKALTTPVRK